MSRPKCLQAYVSDELATRARAAASANGLALSEWLRTLIVRACDNDLSDMIEEARERGHRAVIFDLTGHFIEHFYDASRNVILNPLDARCPRWSMFDECRDEAEVTAAA